MRIDIEYLREFLGVFLESESPFVSINKLLAEGYNIGDEGKCHFHFLQLVERGLVSNSKLETHDPQRLGLSYCSDGVGLYETDLRLTSEGHDFAEALASPTVFDKLSQFKEQPLEVIKDVGSDLAKAWLKQKLNLS